MSVKCANIGIRNPDRHGRNGLIYLGMSPKQYRPWSAEQPYLLPPSPQDWLPPDHLAYFILDVVSKLDLSAIEAVIHAKDPRGERPYPPQLMVALLLYSYCTGTFSSRKIERNTYQDLGTRVIAGEEHPDHSTIAGFRKTHLEALASLFVQVVQLAAAVGLVKLGRVAVDGTRVQANASKHKAMSYDRMKKKRQQLQAQIAELLAKAKAVDEEEDAIYGEDGYRDLPKELERRENRLSAIEEAMRQLEAGARAARATELDAQAANHNAKATDKSRTATARKRSATLARKRHDQASALRDDHDGDGPPPSAAADETNLPLDVAEPVEDNSGEEPDPDALPERSVRHTADGRPHDRAQYNFTDPDSQILEDKGGFVQGFNCQVATTEEHIVVGLGVTNVAPDTHHLRGVLESVRDTTGERPGQAVADGGYWAEENAAYCETHGIDVYISMGRERKTAQHQVASGTDPPPPNLAMRQKMSTAEAREIYRARKWMVEAPIGQIKEAMGFRRFLLRGLEAVRGEWALVCTAHNLLKLWRASAATA
jgi:transposase